MKQKIEQRLQDALAPSVLKVVDDSHKHAGHAGARPEGETHFTVHAWCEAFAGVSPVKCHQLVYKALAEEMRRPKAIHALSIQVLSPA